MNKIFSNLVAGGLLGNDVVNDFVFDISTQKGYINLNSFNCRLGIFVRRLIDLTSGSLYFI